MSSFRWAVVGLMVLGVGCLPEGKVRPRPAVKAGAPVVTRVQISAPAALARGQHGRVFAIAIFSDGTQQDVSAQARWSATGSVAVAAATEVVGIAGGKGTIRAVFGGVPAAAQTMVTTAGLVRLELEQSAAQLPVGVIAGASAVGVFSDGVRVDLSAHATFTSSDSSVIAVLGGGQVRAIGPGAVTLTATIGGLTASQALAVRDVRATRLELSSAVISVEEGTRAPVRATIHFSDGSTWDVTAQAAWSSPEPEVADFAAVGLINARAAGSVTLEASFGGHSARTRLEVIGRPQVARSGPSPGAMP